MRTRHNQHYWFCTEYGEGYEWSPRALTIHEGDFIEWTWTSSSEGIGYRVEQTLTESSSEYRSNGFRSGMTKTANGTCCSIRVRIMVYYYILLHTYYCYFCFFVALLVLRVFLISYCFQYLRLVYMALHWCCFSNFLVTTRE